MEIFVDEYAISPRRFIAGTKGSYGFCTLNLKFSSEWEGLAKRITFYPLDGSGAVYLIISGDEVRIPAEVMRCAGVSKYVISGCMDENVLISVTGEIDVLNSLCPDGEPAEEPTPSQMAQVLSMMQEAIDTAQSVRDDADNGVFDGERGDVGATGASGEKGDKGDKGDPGEVTLEYAHNSFPNALKGTASGEAIAISDASPIEPEMGVKVSGVSDISTVKVKKYGKNIFDMSTANMISNANADVLTKERTGTSIKATTPNGASFYVRAGFLIGSTAEMRGKTFTVSYGKCVLQGIASEGDMRLIICRTSDYVGGDEGNRFKTIVSASAGQTSLTFTIPQDADIGYPYVGVLFGISKDKEVAAGATAEFGNIQVEAGSTLTEYEPYKELTEYEVSADGTVKGVTSLYPTTTLITDTAGAVIDCTYNRDINKAFEELYNAIISLGGNV